MFCFFFIVCSELICRGESPVQAKDRSAGRPLFPHVKLDPRSSCSFAFFPMSNPGGGGCCPRSLSKFSLSAGETYTYHSVARSTIVSVATAVSPVKTSHYSITPLPFVGGRVRTARMAASAAVSEPLPGHEWKGSGSRPHRCGSHFTPSLITDTLTLSSYVSVHHPERAAALRRSTLSGGPVIVGGGVCVCTLMGAAHTHSHTHT